MVASGLKSRLPNHGSAGNCSFPPMVPTGDTAIDADVEAYGGFWYLYSCGHSSTAEVCMARHKVRNSAVVSERDEAWILEANAWARARCLTYFETHTSGIHTVRDVLLWLDEAADAPLAWVRWMSSYQTRYQFVRNSCAALAADGYLSTGRTKNALGRDATSYQYRRSMPWTIAVTPASELDRVTGLLRSWLHAHDSELQGVQVITITQREQQTTHEKQRSGGGEPKGSPGGDGARTQRGRRGRDSR